MGSGNVVTARFVLGLLWGLKNESKRSSLLLWLVCKGGDFISAGCAQGGDEGNEVI